MIRWKHHEKGRKYARVSSFFLRTICAAILLFSCTVLSPAHTTRGHNVVEAAAYKGLLKKARGEISRFPEYSGKDVLEYLIAQRILRTPPCYPAFGKLDPACLQYSHEDSLLWLPVIGSGDMDAIMYRQFSENGQNFHFMATPDDIFNDPRIDERTHQPIGLSLRAYPRALRAMSGMFYDLLFNRLEAKEQYRDIYALIHTVGDSYSEAHTQRDPIEWTIDYLKPWQATSWQPYLVHWSGWRHIFTDNHHAFPTDVRDKHYFKEDSVKTEEIDFYDRNPYFVPREYLNERGVKATNAVEDLFLTTFAVLKRSENDQDHIGEIATEEWRSYLRRHFRGTTDIVTVDTLYVRPAPREEKEWRSLTMIGLRTRFGSTSGARDVMLATTFGKPPNRVDPFAFAAAFDIGRRFHPERTTWVSALSFSLYLWVYSEHLAWGFDPTIVEASLIGKTIRLDPLMSFLRFDGWLSRRLWFSIEGLRYSFINGFRTREFSLTVGVAFSKELMPAHSSNPEKYQPLNPLAGDAWIIPDADSPRRLSSGNYEIFYPFGYTLHREGRHVSLHPWGYAYIWNLNKESKTSQFSLGLYFGPGFEFFGSDVWGFGTLSPLVRFKISPGFALLAEPISVGGHLGISDNTEDRFNFYSTLGAVLILGSIEIGVDLLRYDYRLRRLDQKHIAGMRIGILRE